MAEILDFQFRKQQSFAEHVGISNKDFVDRCRLHLAGFAIAHAIALHEIDRFGVNLEKLVEIESDLTPQLLLRMLSQSRFYTMIEDRFIAFLGLQG